MTPLDEAKSAEMIDIITNMAKRASLLSAVQPGCSFNEGPIREMHN
jgi:hypothetical protein